MDMETALRKSIHGGLTKKEEEKKAESSGDDDGCSEEIDHKVTKPSLFSNHFSVKIWIRKSMC